MFTVWEGSHFLLLPSHEDLCPEASKELTETLGMTKSQSLSHLAQLLGEALSQSALPPEKSDSLNLYQMWGGSCGLSWTSWWLENKHTQSCLLAVGNWLYFVLTLLLLSCSSESSPGVWCCGEPGREPHPGGWLTRRHFSHEVIPPGWNVAPTEVRGKNLSCASSRASGT